MRARRLPPELLVAAVVALIGAVDALASSAFDLVVLFVVVAVLCLVGAVRAASGRALLPVRADLATWVTQTADEQGERPGDVADRAIGTYRAGLIHDPLDPGPPERTP